jgi:hypothetical protein
MAFPLNIPAAIFNKGYHACRAGWSWTVMLSVLQKDFNDFHEGAPSIVSGADQLRLQQTTWDRRHAGLQQTTLLDTTLISGYTANDMILQSVRVVSRSQWYNSSNPQYSRLVSNKNCVRVKERADDLCYD